MRRDAEWPVYPHPQPDKSYMRGRRTHWCGRSGCSGGVSIARQAAWVWETVFTWCCATCIRISIPAAPSILAASPFPAASSVLPHDGDLTTLIATPWDRFKDCDWQRRWLRKSLAVLSRCISTSPSHLSRLYIGLLLSSLESTIVSTALVNIADDFKNYNESNWVVITYLLTYSSFLMVYARLSDITGRKAALLTGVSIFTISSLACGLARTLTELYVSPISAMLRHQSLMRGEHHQGHIQGIPGHRWRRHLCLNHGHCYGDHAEKAHWSGGRRA